jgi:hypothetical protein
MKFIIQQMGGASYNEALALQMAAHGFGWDVIIADNTWCLSNDIIFSKDIGIPYGSQLFCQVIANQMNWKLKMNPFDWLSKVPYKYLHRQVDFMSIKDATNLDKCKFIKPADDKCFDVGIHEAGTFTYNESLPDDTPVLVSDVVQFLSEFRCFVNEKGIVQAQCCYSFKKELNNPKNHYSIEPEFGYGSATDFVNKLLLDHPVITGSVIDVGILEGKGYAVIESNPVWASGIYGCDVNGVLNAMVGSVVK